MVVPDLAQICEIMLFSEGFESAKLLAEKMVVLYSLAKGQLSKQFHYDFGLRALKSVLVMAGQLKRGAPDHDEQSVLMRALRDMNLPKFVYEDVPLFLGLINDLFPGLKCERKGYPDFNAAVESALSDGGYNIDPVQVDKVVQLYETMLTRWTTMVVGSTQGGKSVVINTLAAAQGKLGLHTKLHILNPKALPISELYGVLDPVTRDWTDGLLSNIFRDINRPTEKREARYLVFDGDVDACWVENMNSIMDDNKLLTLSNGERIYLQDHVKLLFEVADLQYASPATVSRCGMVYVDPKNLGYRPYFDKWARDLTARHPGYGVLQGHLEALFDKYVPVLIDFVIDGIRGGEIGKPPRAVIPQANINLVHQLCSMLDSIYATYDHEQGHRHDDPDAPPSTEATDPPLVEAVFIFGLMWSLGAHLLGDSRTEFDLMVKEVSGLTMQPGEDSQVPCGQLPSGLPTLYEYRFHLEQRRWVPWRAFVQPFQPPSDGKFSSILVPTVDTVRNTWLLDALLRADMMTLFIGGSGTAKTVTVQDYLRNVDPDTNVTVTVNFSSRTASLDVQRIMDDNIEKKMKDTFGPPSGKRMLLFVDDLNMPTYDTYGTQQPIAFLKLMLEKNGMYSRRDLRWQKLLDIKFLGAMGPPGGGRNPVDPRLISLFSSFNVTFPSDSSLKQIFSSILDQHLLNFPAFGDTATFNAAITQATLDLYTTIVHAMPPTPSKFHYVFNLRDLSRVFEGLTLSTPDTIATKGELVRLWHHEIRRVFSDRLISAEDREFCSKTVADIIHKAFPDDAEAALALPIVYGDFDRVNEIVTADAGEDLDIIRLYRDLGDYDTIKPVVTEVLEAYNEHHKAMNLVLFEDALEHLTRIHRILRIPRGNALCVGVGGSGKQSLTRLAAFMAGYEIFEITLARGYGETEFREDLKALYGMLGTSPVVFLFTDAHCVEEGFLELINNILTSGVVPALFGEDDKDRIVNDIRPEVQQKGIFDTKDNCWAHYISKCRDNLHLVLCMSPVGDTLRRRARSFPGLINNTTIDWFTVWPEDALRTVADIYLADETLPDEHRVGIIQHMVHAHRSVVEMSDRYRVELRRNNYVTPKNYLDFISNYRRLLAANRKRVTDSITRLDSGLQKLIQAAEEVDIMQVKLEKQQKEVQIKTEACNKLLTEITTQTEQTEIAQASANAKEAEVTQERETIVVEKADAEEDLAKAYPALEAASEALKNLKRDDINEVKNYAQPTQEVRNVCFCVMLLQSIKKEHTWANAKAMMADINFIPSLINFDVKSLTDANVKKVRVFMTKDFTPEKVFRKSSAAGGLLTWVYAMVNYHDVARTVAPKQKKVALMEKSLAIAEKELADTKAEIDRLSVESARLSAELDSETGTQQQLAAEAALMEKRLNAAQRLLTGLGGERIRWTSEMEGLVRSKGMLVADCLVTAAFLSYCGAFTFEFRQRIIADWKEDLASRGVPLSEAFSVGALLTDEVEVAQWASEGLPGDELSVQNGTLTTRAGRWPLCIDPQMQAVTWIKRKEEANGLKIISFNDPDFLKQLEVAIQYGAPVLFENIDEYLDPVIDPVLEKNVTRQGTRKTIKLGDKDVEWDDTFRLYLTTKIANPQGYGPEVFGKTSIINYSVTEQGLADQLLNVTVERERSDLEEKRKALIQTMSDNKQLLKTLEDTLLRELANSTGNILDNDELIGTLEETKAKATEITEKLTLAATTSAEIEKARAVYRPVAKRGAILFFVMTALSNISPMYEYSLAAYLEVFISSLNEAEQDPNLQTRLANIVDTLTVNLYDYVCTSLFETHKLMFSFQMTCAILAGEDRLDKTLLDFLLKGNLALEKSPRGPPAAWIPDQGWEDIVRLAEIDERFSGVLDHISGNLAAWKAWADLEAPEDAPPPYLPDGETELGRFDCMLLLRCFRIDRVHHAVTGFVIATMGERYVQPPVLNYHNIYKQSSSTTPILFVLSPGADPASDIFKLGEKLGYTGPKLKYIALGQGQGPVAVQYLETAMQRGQWVLLGNCVTGDSVINVNGHLGYTAEQLFGHFESAGHMISSPSNPESVTMAPREKAGFTVQTFTGKRDGPTDSYEQSPVSGVTRNVNRAALKKIELLDGTTMTCTTDHRIRVVRKSDAQDEEAWVTAGELRDTDRLVVGEKAVTQHLPPLHLALDPVADGAVFVPAHPDVRAAVLPIHMSDVQRVSAFARLVGFAMADGHLDWHAEKTGDSDADRLCGYMHCGQTQDALDVIADIRCLMKDPQYHVDYRYIERELDGRTVGTFNVRLNKDVAQFLHYIGGVPIGDKGQQEWAIPALWTSDATPTWVVREFVSGLWGGADAHVSATNCGKFGWCAAPDHHANLRQRLETIVAMTERIGFTESPIQELHQRGRLVGYYIDPCSDLANLERFEDTVFYAYAAKKRSDQLVHLAWHRHRRYKTAPRAMLFEEFKTMLTYKPFMVGETGSAGLRSLAVPIARITTVPAIEHPHTFDLSIDTEDETRQNFTCNGIVVHNCHLLWRWLRTLDKLLEKNTKPHPQFRLWLTTDPTDKFPLSVLQRSLKVVTEPPNGLKLNMRSSFSRITTETFAESDHPSYHPLIYTLCFFHAVVQERRRYGKLGYNVNYDFNESDLSVCLKLLATYLNKADDPKAIPWGSLRYLIGEAMYGGRVTCDFDRRIVMTYLDEYMGDFIFDTFRKFHFYTPVGAVTSPYNVPLRGDRELYVQAVEGLPLINSPEVLGLHSNAEIAYLTASTRTMFKDLVSLQPRTGGQSSGVDRESYIGSVADDIVQRLPPTFDMPKLRAKVDVPSPTFIVLLQEVERFNFLIERMKVTLRDLSRALAGEIGMSQDIDSLANSLFNGQLPDAWRRLAPATEKLLGSWMLHFKARHAQYTGWADEGEPVVIWLSGLHIPESYLTALVQTACRSKQWPLDRSTLTTIVTDVTDPAQLTDRPAMGCYVRGLFLEGAGWDVEKRCLRRQKPKELVAEMPVVQIVPIEQVKLKLTNNFKCPVYVNQQRRDAMGVGLVFTADVQTDRHINVWVLQGVGMVLNTVE